MVGEAAGDEVMGLWELVVLLYLNECCGGGMDGCDAGNAMVVQSDNAAAESTVLAPLDEDDGEVLAAFVTGLYRELDALLRDGLDGDPIAGGIMTWFWDAGAVGSKVGDGLPLLELGIVLALVELGLA